MKGIDSRDSNSCFGALKGVQTLTPENSGVPSSLGRSNGGAEGRGEKYVPHTHTQDECSDNAAEGCVSFLPIYPNGALNSSSSAAAVVAVEPRSAIRLRHRNSVANSVVNSVAFFGFLSPTFLQLSCIFSFLQLSCKVGGAIESERNNMRAHDNDNEARRRLPRRSHLTSEHFLQESTSEFRKKKRARGCSQ